LADEPFCLSPCRNAPEELLVIAYEGVFSVSLSYSRFITVSLSFSDPNHPSAFFSWREGWKEKEREIKIKNAQPIL